MVRVAFWILIALLVLGEIFIISACEAHVSAPPVKRAEEHKIEPTEDQIEQAVTFNFYFKDKENYKVSAILQPTNHGFYFVKDDEPASSFTFFRINSSSSTPFISGGRIVNVMLEYSPISVLPRHDAIELIKGSFYIDESEKIVWFEIDGRKYSQLPLKMEKITPTKDKDNIEPETEKIIHIVRKGETLSHISIKYGVSIKDLLECNKKTHRNVRIGEQIKICK